MGFEVYCYLGIYGVNGALEEVFVVFGVFCIEEGIKGLSLDFVDVESHKNVIGGCADKEGVLRRRGFDCCGSVLEVDTNERKFGDFVVYGLEIWRGL